MECLINIVHLNHTLRLSILPMECILPVAREVHKRRMHIDTIYIRSVVPDHLVAEIKNLYPDSNIYIMDETVLDPSTCTM